MNRYLIINADDLGLSPGTNQGILEAHQQGILTSTTAMVNMPDAEAGIRLLHREAPQMGIGLHLTLTTGQPVLPPAQVPSLVDDTGTFPYVAGDPLHHADMMQADEIAAEFQAQFERFVQLAGRKPDHLDSHHHAAYHIPAAFRVLLDMAKAHDLPIRNAATWQTDTALTGPRNVALRQILADGPAPRWTDYFETGFYDTDANVDNLRAILINLPEGVTELMCHPGHYDGFRMYYAAQRERELAVLTDPSMRELVAAQGIQLVTFADQ
ncbi:MAG: chitooligosaccharide deacetylase [Anaerolineaceae bacterium]|nr:chitooligosaccharide deacetylase [Anaerolineaceae bacterium]